MSKYIYLSTFVTLPSTFTYPYIPLPPTSTHLHHKNDSNETNSSSSAASHELAYTTDALIKRAERAREFGAELSREADELRRELERTARECAPEDRSLCAVLDPTGLHLALRLDRVRRCWLFF